MSRAVLLALAVVLGGCTQAPASSLASSPSVSPTATPAPFGSDCAPLDLRDPDGNRVDLSGTWREFGDGPYYYLYEVGECLWYVGGYTGDGPGEPAGDFTVSFVGTITPDFTIRGTVAAVRVVANSFLSPTNWPKTWMIEFQCGTGADSCSGGPYQVALTSEPDGTTYSAAHLVRADDGR